MDAKLFESCVPLYFDHFLQTYGFYIPGKYSLSGRLYDAVFEKHNKTLSISWEPGDGCLEIILFQKDGRKLSDYDDRSQTKSLSDLNSEYSVGKTNSDINEIDIYFRNMEPQCAESALLKKKARELNICFLSMSRLGKL